MPSSSSEKAVNSLLGGVYGTFNGKLNSNSAETKLCDISKAAKLLLISLNILLLKSKLNGAELLKIELLVLVEVLVEVLVVVVLLLLLLLLLWLYGRCGQEFKLYLQTGQVLFLENQVSSSVWLKICPQLFILVTYVPSTKGVLAIGQILKLLLLESDHIKLVVSFIKVLRLTELEFVFKFLYLK